MSPTRLLISRPGHIYLATYSASSSSPISFDLTLPFTGNPSWLAPSPQDSSLLYSFDEDASATYLLKLDLANNTITKVAEQNGSKGVCHLALNKESSRMLGSAYGNGTIDIWNTENGGLKLIKTIQSKHPELDAADIIAHPHQAVLDPTGRFFTVNDLGTNTILLFDSHADSLPVVNRVRVPLGTGPRHGVFFPSGVSTPATHYLVLGEKSNRVIVFSLKYTDSGIEFTQKGSYSTFEEGNSAPERVANCAAGQIILSADNQHVYASNRLLNDTTDTIAHFRVLTSSGGGLELELVGETSTGGRLPRNFHASRDGDELFVGNELGELALVVLGINKDGTLEKKPRAEVKMSDLLEAGEEGQVGPKFVRQIV